jgi:hypothetical protein
VHVKLAFHQWRLADKVVNIITPIPLAAGIDGGERIEAGVSTEFSQCPAVPVA